ncbi:hypothetical protein [Paludisphaera mucosa]|uniref:Polymerase/histidinol phosphatase N-terminal domain-containing protein n=1 Tax=Paludisphaera mucosa TaxID=3030827 RepID=A0ABT6FFU7_9BACT|nr:hypothetical protein [Paludisphaera mucosa]MDG3006407.1 hypothetical protein [Paludisphaera mucosa]
MRSSIFLFILVLAPSIARPQAAPPPGDPARAEPGWFKGNLHTHSLWSDGDDYPEMIVDWYAHRGYQFLALSDHNVLGQGEKWMSVAAANGRARHDAFDLYLKRFGEAWVETRTEKDDRQVRLKPLSEYRTLFEQPGRFLLIQGEELTDRFESKPIHMNATNLLELIKPQGGKSVVDVMTNDLAAVEEQSKRLGRPILGHLNHPNFGYAITAEELAMVTRERFFEVYNGHNDVHHQGDEHHVGVERMWDVINTLRIGEMGAAPVYGLATDDSHHYFDKGGASPGRGWVMVRSRFLTPESIVKGIQAGDFYASSGVALKSIAYAAENRTLSLEIEPRGEARYTTQFVGTPRNYDRTRKPVMGQDGKPLAVTQRYSDDVGKVLATVEGATASYRLTGDELYVRAVVTSDHPPENPSFPGQKAQAWTQPVGWERPANPPHVDAEVGRRPEIRKLGTIDVNMVEATPIVFRDRLYRFEYVRKDYRPNTTGDSYFRLVDVETGEASPAFAQGYDLGCAYAEGGSIWAFAVNDWDGSKVVAFKSDDLKTWEVHPALDLPGWGLFNTSVCKAGDRYVMAIEVGKPPEVVGVPFTTRFAESADLKTWALLPEDRVYTRERYVACPSIRHLDGDFYMTYLETLPGPRYETYIVRSKDLIHWQPSRFNPILAASPQDKAIANPRLDDEQRTKIAGAVDRNNSDMDFCEFHGRTIINYSWGNQQGTEFLAEAVHDGSLASFLKAFFP